MPRYPRTLHGTCVCMPIHTYLPTYIYIYVRTYFAHTRKSASLALSRQSQANAGKIPASIRPSVDTRQGGFVPSRADLRGLMDARGQERGAIMRRQVSAEDAVRAHGQRLRSLERPKSKTHHPPPRRRTGFLYEVRSTSYVYIRIRTHEFSASGDGAVLWSSRGPRCMYCIHTCCKEQDWTNSSASRPSQSRRTSFWLRGQRGRRGIPDRASISRTHFSPALAKRGSRRNLRLRSAGPAGLTIKYGSRVSGRGHALPLTNKFGRFHPHIT